MSANVNGNNVWLRTFIALLQLLLIKRLKLFRQGVLISADCGSPGAQMCHRSLPQS